MSFNSYSSLLIRCGCWMCRRGQTNVLDVLMFFYFPFVNIPVLASTCFGLNRTVVFYFIITDVTVLVVKYMTSNVHVTSRIQLEQFHSMFTRCKVARQLSKLCILSINGCYNVAISRFALTAFILDENEISYL